MASRRSRRGSFGLQPRVAPDVTSTIVALAREYVAKRDALIMDAWRNGGTFEGKKATDSMVLAYWKERGKGLDPSDPNAEQIKDQIMQLQYGIEQSKQDLLHVQGKLSDGAYAQFFLNWAKKVPANSEFYRVLQKDAAQLIESAKNKARINGERARTQAFNDFVRTTTAKDIAIGDALTAAITDLSKATGLSVTGNGDELLSLLTQNVRDNPGQYRILLDTIKAADPHWDGVLDAGYFTAHIKQASQGYDLIADRAQKGGFVSAYASAAQGEANMSTWAQNLRVWPVATSYTQAENAFLRVWNDPTASQMDKQAAASAYSARLTALAQSPGIDTQSRTMIQADAARLLGQDAGDSPSFGTSMLGRQGVDPQMTATISAYTQLKQAMEAQPLAWSYAPVDKNGQFDPTGQGPLGIVPAGAVQPGAQAVMVPSGSGQAVLAMVPTHNVYTIDPNNPSGSPILAGWQISYNVGGRQVQMWGYKDAQGNPQWSLTSPLTEGASVKTDNKGDVYVMPPSNTGDILARAQQIDAKYGTNLAKQLSDQGASLQSQGNTGLSLGGVTSSTKQYDASGKHVTDTTEVSYKNGTFTVTHTHNDIDPSGKVISSQTTPYQYAVTSADQAAFSASRLSAGSLPGVTVSSPLMASMQAATNGMNADQVSKFVTDPAFQQAFLSQTMTTLNTTNPLDPRIADAWKKISTPTGPTTGGLSPDERPHLTGKQRDDLAFPGVPSNPAYQSQLTVNFGKVGQLQLPGLPNYLGNQQMNLSALGNAANSAWQGISTMLPGLGLSPTPAQQPAGSPAPSITPTTAPTATPSLTPTSITPSVPAPTAPPTVTPPPGPTNPYNQHGK